MLNRDGIVSVMTLSQVFATSEITIRKDLNELDSMGKLHRTYGGAKIAASRELPLNERQTIKSVEKERIAIEAKKLISDNDSIFLDAGTSTEHLAAQLDSFSHLIVITNGLNTITKIMTNPNLTIQIPEGRVDSKACSIIGAQAEQSLRKYNARLAFIGVDGITKEQGLMNNSYEATSIAEIMLKQSQKKIVLADSSKFGAIGMISLCDFSCIDTIITDEGISTEYLDFFESNGIEVIIAYGND